VASSESTLLPMMAALYGLALANIFLRSSMGVLAPELASELELAPEMLGAIASGFFLSYALMQIPTGLMLDRLGPRISLIGLFLVTVVGTYMFALAESGWIMLVARLMMGAGCAGVFSGGFMIVARFYPTERFTSVGGTLNSFAMLGTFLATVPLAVAVTSLGWRTTFIVIAIITGIIALLGAVTIKDRPDDAHGPGSTPPRTPAHHNPRKESLGQIFAGLFTVMRTPGVLGIASGGIALSAGNTILGIWGGPYLNDVHGLDEIGRGEVLLGMAFAGVAGHFVYGHAARYFNTLKGMVLAGSLGIASIMALLAAWPEPSTWVVGVLFAALGLVCGFPTILLAHARALVPEYLMGRGLTTVNTGIMISIAAMQIAVGAIIGGYSADGGSGMSRGEEAYRMAFGFIAVMACCTLLVYSRVEDRPPRTSPTGDD
jgi:predicted MFS family arabinose efflux permease